jgi:hypothetical protein
MAEKTEVQAEFLYKIYLRRGGLPAPDIFIYIIYRAVHCEEKVVHALCQRQALQKRLVFFSQAFNCPCKGGLGCLIKVTRVFKPGGAYIVIAHQATRVFRAQDVNAFIGAGIIADNVSKAYYFVDFKLSGLLKKSRKGLKVGVYV